MFGKSSIIFSVLYAIEFLVKKEEVAGKATSSFTKK